MKTKHCWVGEDPLLPQMTLQEADRCWPDLRRNLTKLVAEHEWWGPAREMRLDHQKGRNTAISSGLHDLLEWCRVAAARVSRFDEYRAHA